MEVTPFRMPPLMREAVKAEAERRGVSQGQVVRDALIAHGIGSDKAGAAWPPLTSPSSPPTLPRWTAATASPSYSPASGPMSVVSGLEGTAMSLELIDYDQLDTRLGALDPRWAAQVCRRPPVPVLQPDTRGVAHARPPSVRVVPLRSHPAVDPRAVVQHLHGSLIVEDRAPSGRVPRRHAASAVTRGVEPLAASPGDASI